MVSERRAELKSPVAKAAVFLTILGLGIAMTAWGVLVAREAIDSRRWPSVEGTVIVSETRHIPASQSPNRRSSYEPNVAVEYEVAGQTLVCDRITFTTIAFDSANLAREMLRPYPVGKKVDVYYKPGEPARSVLDQQLRFTAFVVPVVGALLTIGTICVGVWSVLSRGDGSEADAA